MNLDAVSFLVTPLLAALFGALLSGYAVSRWKGRQEHIERQFDELCSIILETADIAAIYWAGTAADEGMRLSEAKVSAYLMRIAGIRVLLTEDISGSAVNEIQIAESNFLREVSGGQFGVHNRESDIERIARCQFAASELILAARRARLRDLRGFWTRQ